MPGDPRAFDNYEINAYHVDQAGEWHAAGGEDQANTWALHGHVTGEGVHLIGAFSSFEEATEIYLRIVGLPYGADHREYIARMRAAGDFVPRAVPAEARRVVRVRAFARSSDADH